MVPARIDRGKLANDSSLDEGRSLEAWVGGNFIAVSLMEVTAAFLGATCCNGPCAMLVSLMKLAHLPQGGEHMTYLLPSERAKDGWMDESTHQSMAELHDLTECASWITREWRTEGSYS